jgi:hypothetical protein
VKRADTVRRPCYTVSVRALVVALVALAFPGSALAGPCGLPDGAPVWVDFGAADVESVLARPGIVAATSTGEYPARLRAQGAQTIYWDMNLRLRVGTTTAPFDPATIEERAHRLFVFAASQTQCATPWIALNELNGANLETPWTPNNAQYRDNVLRLVRALSALGARPFLLISSTPFTGTDEAVAWWRAVAAVSDVVPEVYFNGRSLAAQGPLLANRRVRAGLRRGVARLVEIGIPVTRIGLMLGFQSAAGTGGREGLSPRQEWFRVVKWQALAAREIAAEMNVATVWSWGWGTYSEAGRDPDKADAACAYLWARNAQLCNAPAQLGEEFNASRVEGQLRLPAGAMCKVGASTIGMNAIAKLNRVVLDRDVAYSALLARIAGSTGARVSARDVLAAERAVIALRFAGSRSSYVAALAKSRATVDVARSILADQLRQRRLAAKLRVATPSAASVSGFYFSYPELLVRAVEATPSPWWLAGQRIGFAISSSAPERLFQVPAGRRSTVRTLEGSFAVRPLDFARPLGSVPFSDVRPTISAALRQQARLYAAGNWSASRQSALLDQATCRRDDLPQPALIELTDFLPFLALS